MKKIKLCAEKYLPSFMAILLTIAMHYNNYKNWGNFNEDADAPFAFASTIFAGLLTYKAIILSIDKDKNDGFKKLLSKTEWTTRFFKYFNTMLISCIAIAMYYMVCYARHELFCKPLMTLLVLILCSQLARFVYIFNEIFIKGINQTK